MKFASFEEEQLQNITWYKQMGEEKEEEEEEEENCKNIRWGLHILKKSIDEYYLMQTNGWRKKKKRIANSRLGLHLLEKSNW